MVKKIGTIDMYILKLKNNRKRFPDLIWLIVSIIGIVVSFHAIVLCLDYSHKEFIHKGTIIFRYEDKYLDDEKIIKEQKLLVQFDDLQKIRIVSYDPVKSRIIGDRIVMFLSRDYVDKSSFQDFLGGLFTISLILSTLTFFINLGKNVIHIINDYQWIDSKVLKFRKGIDPLGEEDWDD